MTLEMFDLWDVAGGTLVTSFQNYAKHQAKILRLMPDILKHLLKRVGQSTCLRLSKHKYFTVR
jgi:hypothetical protein